MRNSLNFESALFRELVTNSMAESVWDFGNNVLYEMCRKHPRHDSDSIILGKIWLIGRSYSAAIERRRGQNNGDTDRFYEDVVVPTVRSSEIDKQFDAIRRSDIADLPLHLEVHKWLTDLFKNISGADKRSLASKYLHFHFPERYFIYDSRAAESISLLAAPVGRTLPQFGVRAHDYDYARFVIRCMKLRNQLEGQFGTKVSPRALDSILLGLKPSMAATSK